MGTPNGYAATIKALYLEVAKVLGVDLASASGPERALAYAHIGVTTVLIQALTDNSVLTDAQLTAAVTKVRTAAMAWAGETSPGAVRPTGYISPAEPGPTGPTTPVQVDLAFVWTVRAIPVDHITSTLELRWFNGDLPSQGVGGS